MQITTLLTGVNIVLLLALLYVYLGNYMKLKSSFTLGLISFVALFLIQNVVSMYYYVTMMPYFVMAVETHVLILTVLQTAAFSVFNYLTYK